MTSSFTIVPSLKRRGQFTVPASSRRGRFDLRSKRGWWIHYPHFRFKKLLLGNDKLEKEGTVKHQHQISNLKSQISNLKSQISNIQQPVHILLIPTRK